MEILNKNINEIKIINVETNEMILEIGSNGVYLDDKYTMTIDEKEDKSITCRDCGEEFLFTFNEQRFYEEKGFNAPSRCKNCRDARKQQ